MIPATGAIKFDSEEERLFWLYLVELKNAGYVDEFQHQPKSIPLSKVASYEWEKHLKTKTNKKTSTLLREHVYTPDYRIKWNNKAHGVFIQNIGNGKLGDMPFVVNLGQYFNRSYIEIKPSFDQNNMTRMFTINQKWVYAKYGVYVQKITPVAKTGPSLFKNTFVPKEAMFTKIQRKPKKYHFHVRTFEEYVQAMN